MIENITTKREATQRLFKTTNWNCAGIAYLLGVPRCEVELLAIKQADRRAENFSRDYCDQVAKEYYAMNHNGNCRNWKPC